MDIFDVLSANLRFYRKRTGLSQEGLANVCNLHRTYIGGIEQRRINVSVKNLQKIADSLNIEAYEFLRPNSDRR